MTKGKRKFCIWTHSVGEVLCSKMVDSEKEMGGKKSLIKCGHLESLFKVRCDLLNHEEVN